MNKSDGFMCGCPFVSVEISPWKYHCVVSARSGEDISDLENSITGNTAGIGEVSRYGAAVILAALDGKMNITEASEKLISLKRYCQKKYPVLALFVSEWLFGLFLASENSKELFGLFAKDIRDFPFAGDYAVGDLVSSFFDGDKTGFFEKLMLSTDYFPDYGIKNSPVFAKNPDIYEKAQVCAIFALMKKILSEKGKEFFVPEKKAVSLQAFPILMCSDVCEREITAEYIPFSENTEFLTLICSAIKYTDSLLRQALGTGAKLAGFTLSSEYRRLIADAIRAEIPGLLPPPARVGRKPKEGSAGKRKAETQVFEQNPEPPDLNIDFAKAKRLEAESWKIAELLGADYGSDDISFNSDEIKNTYTENSPVQNVTDMSREDDFADIPEDFQELFKALSEDERKILCLVSCGRCPAAYAKKRGGMLQGFADSINEKASDAYGDIIVYSDGINIDFIEDYKEELTDIFRDMYDTEVL